jgi:endogenous inhibitor of DNA gyrase (YacG/DUF329 family)
MNPGAHNFPHPVINRPMAKKTRLACPICGRENDYFDEPLGPFCSARCKMVDLGKWLGEEYRVSEPLRPDHFAEFEDLDLENPDRPSEQ